MGHRIRVQWLCRKPAWMRANRCGQAFASTQCSATPKPPMSFHSSSPLVPRPVRYLPPMRHCFVPSPDGCQPSSEQVMSQRIVRVKCQRHLQRHCILVPIREDENWRLLLGILKQRHRFRQLAHPPHGVGCMVKQHRVDAAISLGEPFCDSEPNADRSPSTNLLVIANSVKPQLFVNENPFQSLLRAPVPRPSSRRKCRSLQSNGSSGLTCSQRFKSDCANSKSPNFLAAKAERAMALLSCGFRSNARAKQSRAVR